MPRFRGTNDDDLLFGTRGRDTLEGRDGFDTLKGGAGDDLLVGGDGDDSLYGGTGNDTLRPGRNSNDRGDIIFGGAGSDRIDFRGSGPQAGADYSYYEINYAELRGGITVRIAGASGTVTKSSRDGRGTDRLTGMNWTDQEAQPNSATLGVAGTHRNDRFDLDPGDNRFINVNPFGGDDVVTARSGTVRLTYWSGEASGIDVRIAASTNGRMRGDLDDQFGGVDTFSGIQSIGGTRYDDRFTGSSGDDYFITNEGDDVVDGRGGFDLVRYDRTGCVRVELDLAAGTAVNVWDRGDTRRDGTFLDSLTGVENVRGSNGDDTLRGSGAAERLEGRLGDDRLDGRGGRDTLEGGDGDDTIIGGTGDDSLIGGEGVDRFEFRRGHGRDTVADYRDETDVIRIVSGASRFSSLRISDAGDDAVIAFSNVRITLQNVDHAALEAGDFLFG